jgi:serine protease Do
MKRTWLLFSQVVTVLVAAYFVVATLQPDWLRRGAVRSNAGIALLEAPATPIGEVSPGSFAPAAKKAAPAVVSINTSKAVRHPRSNDPWFQFFFGDQGTQEQAGLGSGVIISPDGYILTNNHVVVDATDIYVTLTDGREFKAKVIGTDERTDVALIKIEAKDMTPLVIGDPKKLKKGQWVLAIGSPFGLDSTVTSGIVSAIGRDTGEYLPFIQTDVAVNPGNSGGPLINLDGEVVGINSQIISRSGGFMGISLAIPIDEAMRVVDQLRATGKVTRGRVGVQIGEVGKDVAEAIGLPKAEGALVSSVEAEGPAEQAGVQPGDVILKFNNEPIKRWSDLPRIVGETKPGTRADMQVWRKGKTLTLSVKVGEIPTEKTPAAGKPGAAPAPEATNALGLGVADVPADVQKKLRIKGGVQVKVAEGAAAKAGLQEGDIVLALNDTDVTGAKQFGELVSKLDKGRAAGLLVRRGDQTQWVAVPASK